MYTYKSCILLLEARLGFMFLIYLLGKLKKDCTIILLGNVWQSNYTYVNNMMCINTHVDMMCSTQRYSSDKQIRFFPGDHLSLKKISILTDEECSETRRQAQSKFSVKAV